MQKLMQPLIPTQVWGFKGTALALGDFLSSIYRPCLSAIFAGVISFFFDETLIIRGNVLELLAAHAVVYGTAYIIILACIPHGLSDLKRGVDILRLVIGKKFS